MGLWPIEAALIAFSGSKKRLGDRWAGIVVVRYRAHPVWWKRLAPAAAAGAGMYGLLALMTPRINARMEISGVACVYVEQELDAVALGAPHRVNIIDDRGSVTMRLSDGRSVRIHLSRTREGWTARGVETIPDGELGRGFSIQQGTASASSGL